MPTLNASRRIGGQAAKPDGSISKHVPYTRLVDEHTIATKDGALMRVFHIVGWPFETSDLSLLDSLKHQRNLLYRSIADAQTGLYSHIIRRKIPVIHDAEYDATFTRQLNDRYNEILQGREVYENSLYLTLIVRPTLLNKTKGLFGKKKVSEEGRSEELRRQKQALDAKTSLIGKSLSTYGPRLLGARAGDTPLGFSEPLEFLHELINGERVPVAPPRMGIDRYIGARRVIFGSESCYIRGSSRTEERHGAVISIKEYQPETAAGSLDHLMELPQEMIITQSFAFLSRKKSLDRLEVVARRYRQAEDSVTLEQQINDAKEAVQVGGIAFGQHHLSILVKVREAEALDNAVDDVINAFGQVGAIAVREDTNLEAAYWAQLPANFAYIARDAGLSSLNFAGLASLHNYPYGQAHGNHWGPCVTIFETLSGTPYHFNFHVNSLGNFTITGASGSGKTVLLNFLLNMAQKFNPRTFFMDKDEGAKLSIKALGGSYATIRHGQPTGFNPFQLPDTPENRGFLAQFVKTLLARKLAPAEDLLLDQALEANARAPVKARRLRHFAELFIGYDRNSTLPDELRKWHGSGEHAWLFDCPDDKFPTDKRMMGFDLTSVLDIPELRTPVLLYMFHRIQLALDGTRTLIFIDEGWKALSDPTFEKMIRDWLKTIRKLNGVLGIGTQEVGDIINSPIANTLIEQCPTQIFLPNYKAKADQYQTAFELTDGEFAIIKNSPQGARHFLIKQGMASAVAKLDLSGLEDELAIMSGTAKLNKLAETIWAEVGEEPDDWLPRFFNERSEHVS